jgi:catechol 2,3-dioxygenase-like lactoylglutathione lyase family enzyme
VEWSAELFEIGQHRLVSRALRARPRPGRGRGSHPEGLGYPEGVSVVIDHLALPATSASVAAQWLAGILGLQEPVPDGPDGDMYNVRLSGESSLLFVTELTVPSHHVAFGVSEADFTAIVDRLRQRGISFGNDPEDPANGATLDPLGGKGRVYFPSPDGHFFEVTIRGA